MHTKNRSFYPAKVNEKVLLEIVKKEGYIFIEPELKKKGNYTPTVYAKVLYNILDAMQGQLIFDTLGLNLPG